MIKLGMAGLAKFMTAGEAARRKILRDYKYPDPEGSAQATYYREARDLIANYHRGSRPASWLLEKATTITSLAQASSGQTKTRLHNNARALRDYGAHFAAQKFEVLGDLNLRLHHGAVSVTVCPDLHVKASGRPRIIKLGFLKDEPSPTAVKVITQCMLEAATSTGLGLSGSDVLYMDSARGEIHKARAGSKIARDIEAACETIADIWPRL